MARAFDGSARDDSGDQFAGALDAAQLDGGWLRFDGDGLDRSKAYDAGGCQDCGPIDVESLLGEMIALRTLAAEPRGRFRTCMASSYDRTSTVPQAMSETATGWYANHDWGNFAGTGRAPSGEAESILLETDGPGVVVRIWSATPTGVIRIYIDGSPTPVLEAPVAALLGGLVAPFLPPFAGMTAHGANLEFPIPFSKHIKVAWQGNGSFYQVTYRRYFDPETKVTSFDLATIDAAKLNELARVLLGAPAASATASAEATLGPQSPEMRIAASPVGGEIVSLRVRPSMTNASALRGSILSIRFDGQETVRAPLGDFFGAGPGLIPHKTLPLDVTAEGLLSARFVMPFAKDAVVRIEAAPGLQAEVTVSHREAPFGPSSHYFHAHWSARGPMPVRPYRDIVLADVTGAGAYVGTLLNLANSSQAWWGEGDEKIWVDDDAFPSLFGTGTEDYFGQGYCSPETYEHPFRAQTLAAGGFGAAQGLFSLFRAHVLDPIRFQGALKFSFELWHWDEVAEVTFDTISYFYLAPSGTDNLPLPSSDEFRLSPLSP